MDYEITFHSPCMITDDYIPIGDFQIIPLSWKGKEIISNSPIVDILDYYDNPICSNNKISYTVELKL